MQLNQTVEYAFRAMTHLAFQTEDEPLMRAKELAEKADVPPHYLSKILRKLVTAGLLHSQKGHGGGFQITKPLEEIRYIDIIEAIDYDLKPNHCAFGWGKCNPDEPCPLHDTWSELNCKVVEWAEKKTLATVVENGSKCQLANFDI